jgi:hypothetical protein
MQSVIYVGKILSDGHLSLSEEARKALKLEVGQEVEVVIRPRNGTQRLPDEAFSPLRKLIGLSVHWLP